LRYTQRIDGEPILVPWREQIHRIACCDCGLVHDFEFEVKGKYVVIRATRNNKATAQRRRALKAKVEWWNR